MSKKELFITYLLKDMVRVKRGIMTRKRHKNLFKKTKGYRLMNKNVFSRAKNAWMKAGLNAYVGRKRKKREFRALWIVRLNNALKNLGYSYSRFIHAMYLKRITLNRKILAYLAVEQPTVFEKIVAKVMVGG